MRVLVIEDDKKMAELVVRGLQELGANVDTASNGLTGFKRASAEAYDVIVVDLGLPGMDGFEIIERLRSSGILTPILILTARHAVDDRVAGLQRGGDDYLTKPFAFAELFARLQALVRRARGTAPQGVLQVGDLCVDPTTRSVTRGKTKIDLQLKEYDLLMYLLENSGRVVSKSMIIKQVWKYNFDPRTNIVEARICRLREKLEVGGLPPLIHTIRGGGYVLKAAN